MSLSADRPPRAVYTHISVLSFQQPLMCIYTDAGNSTGDIVLVYMYITIAMTDLLKSIEMSSLSNTSTSTDRTLGSLSLEQSQLSTTTPYDILDIPNIQVRI